MFDFVDNGGISVSQKYLFDFEPMPLLRIFSRHKDGIAFFAKMTPNMFKFTFIMIHTLHLTWKNYEMIKQFVSNFDKVFPPLGILIPLNFLFWMLIPLEQ